MEYTIIYILFAHFIADFICQTDEMAQNKSTSWKWLSIHITVYTSVLFAFSMFITDFNHAILYALVNGLIHFGVDAITSRINSHLWKQGKVHWFFVGVGADQFIHAASLILTLSLLK